VSTCRGAGARGGADKWTAADDAGLLGRVLAGEPLGDDRHGNEDALRRVRDAPPFRGGDHVGRGSLISGRGTAGRRAAARRCSAGCQSRSSAARAQELPKDEHGAEDA
jgi:hypothetical protein